MYACDDVLNDMKRRFVLDYGKFCEIIGSLNTNERLIKLVRLETQLDNLFFLDVFTEKQYSMYRKAFDELSCLCFSA